MDKPPVPKRVRYDDPKFEEKVLRIFDSLDSDVDLSDQEDDAVLESEHDTNSVQSADEEPDYRQDIDTDQSSYEESEDHASEDEDEGSVPKYYYGRNRFKWSATAPIRNVRTPAHNIIKIPTSRFPTKNIDPVDAWLSIFTEDMIAQVIHWTNKKIISSRTKFSDPSRTELRETTVEEIKCFFGLLIYTAIFKSNHEDIRSLFATDGTGRDVFRLSLSAKRFAVLLNCLRFDNPDDREEHKQSDPGAAVSELLQKFNASSQASFSLGSNATVDEMLVAFRGNCRFKMYMPSKPAKYGLKLQCLADARTSYVYNTYLYCGKGSDSMGLSQEEKKYGITTQAVIRLCKPLYHTNRNITTDNWYTSLDLVKVLKDNGLTLVGTIKKNKKEIPAEFQPARNRQVGSVLYGFTKYYTLLSYVSKKNKAVLLLSSMHHSIETDHFTKKPEIIAFYNNTKGGVDAMDQKCSVYSSSRRTRRWTMAIFFRILDMSTTNAYIMHQSLRDRELLTRLEFMKTVAKQLIEPYMRLRIHNNRLPRELRSSICRILGEKNVYCVEADQSDKLDRGERKTCSLCPAKKRRKTAYLCFSCKRPICLECSKKLCVGCATGEEQ